MTSEPTNFYALDLLSAETIEALYPWVKQAIVNDMEGGHVRGELENLKSSMRAELQRYNVWVDL